MINYCKDCTDRTAGCHSGCMNYILWKSCKMCENEKINKVKQVENALDGQRINAAYRLIKRKNMS